MSQKTPIIPYIMGIRFLAIFWAIGLKFFMKTQDTIIYRLIMRNHSFGPYLPFQFFGPYVGPKMGQVSENPTKKLTHWVDLLGTPLSRNHVSDFFGGPTPPPPPLSETGSTC